jgi:hypothetical protein
VLHHSTRPLQELLVLTNYLGLGLVSSVPTEENASVIKIAFDDENGTPSGLTQSFRAIGLSASTDYLYPLNSSVKSLSSIFFSSRDMTIIQKAADAFVLATADDEMQDRWIPDEEWVRHIRSKEYLKPCMVKNLDFGQ